ncbi:MAG: hypothetical protein J1D88_05510 [Treponema sp.]|nr:hypothetical protein [Treponema sp.]
MKKMFGTKLALLLAAAVLAAGAFTACSSGDDGGNDGGLGGHIGENPFKGLTLEYEDEYSYKETYSFTSDTKGHYIFGDRGEYYQRNFEYAVDSTKGMLKFRVTSSTDGNTTFTVDGYIKETYGNLDSETKSILRDALANEYRHYKFADDRKSVEMISDYYFGNVAECDAGFRYVDDDYNSFSFGRYLWFDIGDDDGWHWYVGYPKFSGNTFTAVIFEENEDEETETYTYRKLGTALKGTYQISGTGTNCKGTVTFTQLPKEFQDVFKTNEPYNVAQEDYGYTTYTVKQ